MDPLFFWSIVLSAVVIGFFMQAIVGFSGNLIAIPILLLVMDIKDAVGMMSGLLVVFSLVLVWNNRKDVDWPTVKLMGVWTVFGVTAGVLALRFGNPVFLKRVLGVFMILYVAQTLLYRKPLKLLKKAAVPLSIIGGVFSGLFSTGGGLYVMYLDTTFKNKQVMRATLLAVLGINNLLRFPLLAATGIITWDLLKITAIALPFFLVAIWLGQKAYKRMNQEMFRNAMLVLLVAGGVLLLVQ